MPFKIYGNNIDKLIKQVKLSPLKVKTVSKKYLPSFSPT